MIQNRSVGGPNSPLVGRFQAKLNALAAHCTESVRTLSDELVVTHKILVHGNAPETYLALLGHIISSIPAKMPPMRCADVFAVYATLRQQGPAAALATPGTPLASFIQNLHDTAEAVIPAGKALTSAENAISQGSTAQATSDLQTAQAGLSRAQSIFNAGPLPPAGWQQVNTDMANGLAAMGNGVNELSSGLTANDSSQESQGESDIAQGTADFTRSVQDLQARIAGSQSSTGNTSSATAPTNTPVPVIPTATAVTAPTPQSAALSPDQTAVEVAVTKYHNAVHAWYGPSHDGSSIDSTATGNALAAVSCVAQDRSNSLIKTHSSITYTVLGLRVSRVAVTGDTATLVEQRHDILTLHNADGSTNPQDESYTATYTLNRAGGGWMVADYTWDDGSGSTGSATDDVKPCASAAAAETPTPNPQPADTPTPNPGSRSNQIPNSSNLDVSAWVDPDTMPYDAYPTLDAKTTPGATCTASVTYDTGRSPVSFGGEAQTADSSGSVSWPWHEETEGSSGSAEVDCTLGGQAGSGLATFTVTG